MKKPFKETGVGKFLQSKGFDFVLDMVGDVVPGVDTLSKVKDLVLGNKKIPLSPEDQAQFISLLEAEQNQLDAILADVANARSRQVELAKTGFKDYMFPVVTIFILAMFLLIVIKHLFFPAIITTGFNGYEETIKNLVLLIGGYFYGSTRGSREKTQLLASKNE